MFPTQRSVQQMANMIKTMQDGYRQIQQERRRLHNLVLELKGNIRVFARTRPLVRSPRTQSEHPRVRAHTAVGRESSLDAGT